jgi:ABC-type bacteriocin/lantibiotic exporter with double-glycine peptidase domain
LSACAAMILDHLGRVTPYDRLLKLLQIAPDLGAPASNILRLSALNLSVEYRVGQVEDLIDLFGHSQPCIAFLNTLHLSYWAEATSHAAVVVGLDEQYVYLNDPFFDIAPQRVSRLEFELAWDDMDNTYAIITL